MSTTAPTAPAREASGKKAATRILVVDDHPVFRRGLIAVLEEHEEFTICGEASDNLTALESMRGSRPDVALLDITMPGANGIELIKLMLAEQPKLSIIVLSMHDEALYGQRALRAGAKGYVMKSEVLTHVVEALRKVIGGGIYLSENMNNRLISQAIETMGISNDAPVDRLSDRELEVLQLIGKGISTRDIAAGLHLSIKTIETHRAHIKEKLGFRDSSEMVRYAIGWVAQQQE